MNGASGAIEWIKEHRAGVVWSVVLVALGLLVIYASTQWSAETNNRSRIWEIACIGLATVGVALGAHFVHCFTRDLPSPKERLSRELRSIFVYAYVFQVLAIGVALGPFAMSADLQSSRESWAGVVHGCQRASDGTGSELTRCSDGPSDSQWLLHVGSRSFSAEGGASDEEVRQRTELSRGLVVPLYVVVLAIIGAAVGMTRRLPEIQRRAAHTTHQHEAGDAISPIIAREKVIFQIMQILAAPLIAIVAFSGFDPDTVTAAVLLGFASGFASEAILMKLRQASEAVVGKSK